MNINLQHMCKQRVQFNWPLHTMVLVLRRGIHTSVMLASFNDDPLPDHSIGGGGGGWEYMHAG